MKRYGKPKLVIMRSTGSYASTGTAATAASSRATGKGAYGWHSRVCASRSWLTVLQEMHLCP